MDILQYGSCCTLNTARDIPLRVTFYARVSTDSDEQLNSLDNQIGYYRDYIIRNPCMDVHRRLYRRGLSGMTTRKRDNFSAWFRREGRQIRPHSH